MRRSAQYFQTRTLSRDVYSENLSGLERTPCVELAKHHADLDSARIGSTAPLKPRRSAVMSIDVSFLFSKSAGHHCGSMPYPAEGSFLPKRDALESVSFQQNVSGVRCKRNP